MLNHFNHRINSNRYFFAVAVLKEPNFFNQQPNIINLRWEAFSFWRSLCVKMLKNQKSVLMMLFLLLYIFYRSYGNWEQTTFYFGRQRDTQIMVYQVLSVPRTVFCIDCESDIVLLLLLFRYMLITLTNLLLNYSYQLSVWAHWSDSNIFEFITRKLTKQYMYLCINFWK